MSGDLKEVVLAELAKGTHTEAFADGARWAAQEAAKLVPRPLIDLAEVDRRYEAALDDEAGVSAGSLVGIVEDLARPMPTQAELTDWLREIFTADPGGTSFGTAAEELLALLNGSES